MAPKTLRIRALLALATGLALGLGACGDTPAKLDNLYLSVTSEAPPGGGRLDKLRFLLARGEQHYPVQVDAADFTQSLGSLDPVAGPVWVAIKYDGTAFSGPDVRLIVTGLVGDAPATRFEGGVDLGAKKIVAVHLSALPTGCDVDGDGFFDCTVAGCCVADSAFADCEPNDRNAHPWAVEPACEPCADTVDQDCQGGDQPCVDADNDGVEDCREAAESCGVGDPAIAPGLAERCDGLDNNCVGGVDEGFALIVLGQPLAKGAACGTGVCAGGTVVCAGLDAVACSTDAARAAAEVCDNNLDDDCDGDTDEGCGGDVDGDGWTTAAGDCDDYDAGRFPNNPVERCCPRVAEGDPVAEARCDTACTGTISFCDVADTDGDGYTAADGDCDDTDPLVHPDAPERCGDGVDQDCFAGDQPCAGLVDVDGDGWPVEHDCDDTNAALHPGADEVCDGVDNDCDTLVDEGNPDTLAVCGSDVGECATGREVCVNSGGLVGVVDCLGDIEAAAETCDGQDDDCDGETDEDFRYDDAAIGAACDGRGACGAGIVQCSTVRDEATCSTNPDGAAPQHSPEVCDTEDNDCDGDLNEGLTDPADSDCSRLGVCGAGLAQIVAACQPDGSWSCSYLQVPGYEGTSETSCDGLDNDCDGVPDDEFHVGAGCDGADSDSCDNGVVTCVVGDVTQTYCDESGAATAVEKCDGLDNDCDGLTDEDFKPGADNVVTLAGAAYVGDNGKALGAPCGTGVCGVGAVVCKDATSLSCNTPIAPTTDLCDGVDNDCDGQIDEEYLPTGTVKYNGGPWTGGTDTGRGKGEACGTGACTGGLVVCAQNKTTLTCDKLGLAGPDTCDAADNDCDGQTDEPYKAGGTVTYSGGPYAPDANKVLGQPCGTGACAGGTVVCDGPGSLTCSRLNLVATDVCDGADNDCDGATDDDYLVTGSVKLAGALLPSDNGKAKGQPCGTGPCAGGTVACGGPTSLVCSSNGQALVETCDEADEDCDGVADDGLTYTAAPFAADLGKLKGATCGTGACVGGTVACAADHSGLTCTTVVTSATAESCDGVDQDCDGATDEEFKTSAYHYTDALYVPDLNLLWGASCGTGACAGGHVGCNVAGDGLACDTVLAHRTEEACDAVDNDCDGTHNEGFPNQDGDQLADCVDPDLDGDGVNDDVHGLGLGVTCHGGAATACDDNCPYASNADQGDLDDDSVGNACDPDVDGDGVNEQGAAAPCNDAIVNCNDNCPALANPTQADLDNDGLGDACDPDEDGDGILNDNPLGGPCTGGTMLNCDDNCPRHVNPNQEDLDHDGLGNLCDPCNDADDDGWGRGGFATGECPNPGGDCDDTVGNLNDIDHDNICVSTGAANCTGGATTACRDNCPSTPNPNQSDLDGDGVGDVCDPCTDADLDGWGRAGLTLTGCAKSGADCDDTATNAAQDADGDNVCASLAATTCGDGQLSGCNDNCPGVANPTQANADATTGDADSLGDACDPCTDADGDDFGRGTLLTGCADTVTPDCDDTSGNTSDPDHDNRCGAADNCPTVANANQSDVDADGLGDLCDPCEDHDHDGWGKTGTTLTGCSGAGADCDDTADNVNDVDADNVCINTGGGTCTGGATTGCNDNCPSVSNPTQADADGDSTGDVCDLCTDADGDGWGRAGLVRSACLGLPLGAADCNDDPTANATDDGDADNVCASSPPGAPVCADGVFTACLDNCPGPSAGDTNPDQSDSDGDGIGDVCDDCAHGQEPFEVCGDCLDNDCDGVIDEAGCVVRRIVAVQVDSALPTGYALPLTFDHAFMVAHGESQADGSDVRLYWHDAAHYRYEEIDLVLDPASSWNFAYTRLWFATQAPLTGSATDTSSYLLVFGATGAPTARDAAAVFHYADLFDRIGDSLGNGWTEVETPGTTSITLGTGALFFDNPGDAALRPYAYTDFPAISDGLWQWRFGFNWTRDPAEGTYRVLMQLGQGSAMTAPGTDPAVFPNAGVGVSLVWGGAGVGLVGEERLGFEVGGAVATAGELSGATDLEVTVDLDAVVPSYTVASGAGAYGIDGAFSQAVTSLDRVRFISDRVSQAGATGRSFDYVIVRPLVAVEPLTYLGAKEPVACALSSSSVVARYYADDPIDGVTNTLRDSEAPATSLTRSADTSPSPNFHTVGGDYAVCWASGATYGRFNTSGLASSAELVTGVNSSKTVTVELVLENYAQLRSEHTIFFNYEDSGNAYRFTLRTTDNATVELRYDGGSAGSWPLDFTAAQRVVLHVVWDTAQDAAADRVRLYRNGHLVTRAVGAGSPTKNRNTNLGSSPSLTLGNRRAPTADTRPYAAPYGCIYYTAIYSAVLSDATLLSNATRLLHDDDRLP